MEVTVPSEFESMVSTLEKVEVPEEYKEGTITVREENTENVMSFNLKSVSLVKKAIRFN